MALRILLFGIIVALFYTSTVTITGCAVIVPPGGGPRDSLPPTVVKVNPTDRATNVRPKSVVFEFDEYVQTENAEATILISPLPASPPEIRTKLRNVTIRFRDTLQSNTTYTIAINGAVKDVNEGNKLNDLTYTFSTGNTIDSNTIGGKVILAETGKVDSTLIAVLYANTSDSAVAKERPLYIAKLNGSGEFKFINLPAKPFRIYAYADEGGQKKYTSPKQVFAYSDSSINAANNTANVIMYAYTEEKEIPKPVAERTTDVKLRLSNTLQNGLQDILSDLTILANKKMNKIDTAVLLLTDSTQTKYYSRTITIDSLKRSLTIKSPWIAGNNYRLIIPKDAISDAANNTLLKADTIKFTAKNKKDYGKVIIRFNNITLAKKPVLQVIQNDKLVFSYPITNFKLTIDLLPPGDYDLRLLYDTNNNGVWNAGSFYTNKKQPELVVPISKKLNVKADWDNELEIDEKL